VSFIFQTFNLVARSSASCCPCSPPPCPSGERQGCSPSRDPSRLPLGQGRRGRGSPAPQGVVVSLSAGSRAAAALSGTAAVALAPVFTARRMRRMDVPSTLRVVE
jgi:hypothetical protein